MKKQPSYLERQQAKKAAAGTKAAIKRMGSGEAKSGSTTFANVGSSTTSATILAANGRRLGATVFNDSTAVLYLKLGTGPASSSSYTIAMGAGSYYEVPYRYSGIITGLWAASNGSARVTEYR